MGCRVAQYREYKDSEGKGDWNNGILNISLSSWDEFHNVTAQLHDLGDFIWRGQIHDWPLKSKFDRVVKKSDRDVKLESHCQSFIHAIQGRRGNNPPELDTPEKIWSLGQHYGLVTPLLDWTESPFVAAYFAFKDESCNMPEPPSQRFIYGLSKDIGRWGPPPSEVVKRLSHFIEFVETDSDENSRLLNQRGLFTMPLSADIEIEETVRWCYSKDEKKGQSRIIFVKIQIPETQREICLRNLNRMNINHATLFPDLIGAAEYCNLNLKIENYS